MNITVNLYTNKITTYRPFLYINDKHSCLCTYSHSCLFNTWTNAQLFPTHTLQ